MQLRKGWELTDGESRTWSLESFEVVSRKAKNIYIWYGLTRRPQALQRQYLFGPPQNDKIDDDDLQR